jgi:hypothetical protein
MKRKLMISSIGVATVGLILACSVAVPQRRERELRARLAELNGRIHAGREAIDEVRALEIKCAGARTQLGSYDHGLTRTPALVWFPDKMGEYFRRFAVEKVSTRVNTSAPDPTLRGYERIFWAITLPLTGDSTELRRVMRAVSELETAEPQVRVVAVTVSGDSQSLGGRKAVVTASLLTRQL